MFFFDARTHRRLGRPYQTGGNSEITSIAFSPDGSRLASTGWHQQGGFVDLFDARTRRHLASLAPNDALWDIGARVEFSPDSRTLVLQAQASPDQPNRLLHFDARTGELRGEIGYIPGRASILLGFAGSRIVTTSKLDRETVVRDVETLRGVGTYPASGDVGTTSRDGALIALGSEDGTVRLVDTNTGAVRTGARRHDGAVTSLRFSADARRLVTAGGDQRLIVWDTRHMAQVETLEASGRGPMMGIAIAPGDDTAHTAGRDGTVVSWDLKGARRLERPFALAGTARATRVLAGTGHGAPIMTTNARGFVDLFDARRLRPAGRVRVGRTDPLGVEVAPDGRAVATTSADGGLRFWDTGTGRQLGGVETTHEDDWVMAYSGDGRWLAVGGGGATTGLWDARRRVLEGSIDRQVLDVGLSRDGKTLAATLRGDTFAGGLELYSVPDLQLIRPIRVPAGERGRFSADGRSFIYGDRQGGVWVFDARTWKQRGRMLDTHGALIGADLSGNRLVTTYFDGTARLWDTASGRPIGAPLVSSTGNILGAEFLPGGDRLAIVHERGGYVWDVRPASWERRACAVAGRRLTRAEWKAALAGPRLRARLLAPASAAFPTQVNGGLGGGGVRLGWASSSMAAAVRRSRSTKSTATGDNVDESRGRGPAIDEIHPPPGGAPPYPASR